MILNLVHGDFSNPVAAFSTLLALGFGSLVIAFPPYEAYNAIIYYRELQAKKRPTYFRLNVLFYDFGIVNNWQFFYYWQFFLRRFLLALMLVAWPQDNYLTLSCATMMHVVAMLYIAYVKPFNSHVRNFATLFTETGLVAMHGVLFAFAKSSPGLGKDHFMFYGFLFGLFLLIIICFNLLFVAIDSFKPLHKLGVILNILEERDPDENPNRIVEEFSNTNDTDGSMTEKNLSVGSNNAVYDAVEVKDEDEFMLEGQKEDEEKEDNGAKAFKRSGVRPQTPPKTNQPLVSRFNQNIGLAEIKDDPATGKDAPPAKTPTPLDQAKGNTLAATGLPKEPTPPKQLTPQSQSTPEPLNPPAAQNEPLEESKGPGNKKIITPNVDTGFAGGDFANALQDSDSDK